jgi:hypothetical protein
MLTEARASRRLNTTLLLGLLVAPFVFAWLLLRPGYSNSLRAAAFTSAAFGIALSTVRFFSP